MGLMVTESEKSKHDMLRAMRKHIRENGITDFTDFQDWCDENNDCWSLALDSISTSAVECFRPPLVIFITPILKYRELGDTVLDDVPSHRPHLLEKLRGGGNHGD